MPKSKRNKVVSLTKTRSKGREGKEALISAIRGCLDEYPRCYVFRFRNMKNVALKKLREELKGDCRFFLGSNKVMRVALGRDEASEQRQGLAALGERLSGFAGLLFTARDTSEIEEMFALHEDLDFARPGQKAIDTVEYPEGPVVGAEGLPLAHTLEPTIRSNGMPSKLNHGVVELISPYTVCKDGQELGPKQCALLRIFGIKMARFTLTLDSVWEDGEVTVINEADDDEEELDEADLIAQGFEVEY
mmetsp:Transcript_11230/g.23432  ORF Transcript_11230/g.23432 Transcript_11230/m.23432 type:complete len:247 (-) Transcript_11230:421-1161(-)